MHIVVLSYLEYNITLSPLSSTSVHWSTSEGKYYELTNLLIPYYTGAVDSLNFCMIYNDFPASLFPKP